MSYSLPWYLADVNYFTFLTVYFPAFEYYDVSFSNRTFKDLLYCIRDVDSADSAAKLPKESPFPFTLKEAKETIKLLKVYAIIEKIEGLSTWKDLHFYIVNFKTHKRVKI